MRLQCCFFMIIPFSELQQYLVRPKCYNTITLVCYIHTILEVFARYNLSRGKCQKTSEMQMCYGLFSYLLTSHILTCFRFGERFKRLSLWAAHCVWCCTESCNIIYDWQQPKQTSGPLFPWDYRSWEKSCC